MHVVTLYNNANKVIDIDHEHIENYSNKFIDKYYLNLIDAQINNKKKFKNFRNFISN